MRSIPAIAFVSILIFTSPVLSQMTRPIAKFNDWSAHIYDETNKRLCFVSSQPKEMLPTNVNRGKVLFYVSTWSGEGVKHEVSIKIGYPFQPGSNPVVEIGTDKYTLFVKKDKAFVASNEDEQRLVGSMMRGSTMIVKGVSKRGTLTTDTYSLAGISAALQSIKQYCP